MVRTINIPSSISMKTADDLNIMWHRINMMMANGEGNMHHNMFRGDHYLNLFDITMVSSSHRCPVMTLEQLAYTPKKANHLLRSYLDPNELHKWLKKIKDTTVNYGQVDSDIILQTKRESKHGNGPCLMGFSYRSRGGPNLTIFSRSAELPQLFGADCLLASALGHMINETLGVDEDIRVVWFIASARIKSRMANLYRIYRYPEPVTYFHAGFQDHIDKGWDKFLVGKHPVTFIKLVRLQELYDHKIKGTFPNKTGQKEFTDFVRNHIESNVIGDGSLEQLKGRLAKVFGGGYKDE